MEQQRNQPKGKTNDTEKGKALESAHYVVAQCNIGVNEDLFNASLSSWKNDWFLDSGETCLLGPYNTSDYPITIVVIPLIYIVVPLLPACCYFCAP